MSVLAVAWAIQGQVPRDRTIYPRPPIVEAVIELKFRGGASWVDGLGQRVRSRLGDRYPGQPRTSRQLEVQAEVTKSGVATSARTTAQAQLYPSADGRRLIGVGDGILTIHVLDPYPGWEEFRSRAQAAFEAYVSEVDPKAIETVGVRYIDRIALQWDSAGTVNFGDFFVWMPGRPETMPSVLEGFHVLVHSRDRDDGTVALLRMGSAPQQDGRPVVLYDLNLVREFPGGSPVSEWLAAAEKLHTRQRDIFEESITDRTRELFK